MKRRRRLLLVVLFLAVIGIAVWLVWARGWTPPGYDAVQEGMTAEEVARLLRPPCRGMQAQPERYIDVHEFADGEVWVGYQNGRVSFKFLHHPPTMLDRAWGTLRSWWASPPATMVLTAPLPTTASVGQQ